MVQEKPGSRFRKVERVDVSYDYALCAWARHFNVSEQRVKEAVAAVGDRADSVGEHLRQRPDGQERPSGY
jgi:hypothetical protein